jgi:energy-coupling factor transport system permease protein
VTGAALSLAWGGWVAVGVALLTALAALRAGRIRRLAVAALALAPVAASSLLINALLPAGGGGLTTAVAALLRLLGATLPLTLLFATTEAPDLLSDLEARGAGRRAVFVLGAALAAVPRAQARAVDVIEAQRARGLDTEGSWRRRLHGMLPLITPLIIGSLAEVEDRTMALEVRAFGAPGRRTLLHQPPDSRGQQVARWATAALLVLGLAARAVAVAIR